MTEPDVTLTDFALALECAIFALLVARASSPPMRRWWVLFFGSIGLSAFCGGLVHGYFNDRSSAEWAIVWRISLLAIGVTSMATWSLGAYLQQGDRLGANVRKAAVWILAVYAIVVLTVSTSFLVAILFYLPATLFMLVAIVDAYRRSPTRAEAYGIAGLVLTFIAAAIQQLQLGIHPQYFNHNAMYHAIQAIALFLLFLAARDVKPASVREVLSEPAL
jgi:uncharacterized protein DUF6962